jgi:hypothetical protein
MPSRLNRGYEVLRHCVHWGKHIMLKHLSVFAMLAGLAVLPASAQALYPSSEPITCDGVFSPDTTQALIKDSFGAENVVNETVYGAEGWEYIATVAFPNDPAKRTVFTWADEEKLEGISMVELPPGAVALGGVKTGMSVADIEQLHGARFSMTGFWWDYGGYPNLADGALDQFPGGCSLALRFSPDDDLPESLNIDAVSGDVEVWSDNPLLGQIGAKVSSVSIVYPWIEGEGEY